MLVLKTRFSLIEMLIIVSIIFVIISLLSPSLAKLSNQANKIIGPTSQPRTAAFLDIQTQISNIKNGALFNYTNSLESYRCSMSEENDLRSFSSIHTMNGSSSFVSSQGGKLFKSILDIDFPSKSMVFLDDYNEDWDASYAIPRIIERWWNPISLKHKDGINWVAADGHAEFYEFTDPRTLIGITDNWIDRLSIMNSIDLSNNNDIRSISRKAWGELNLPYE